MGFFKAFGRKLLSNKADPFWSDWRLWEQMVPLPWSRCQWPSRWPPQGGGGGQGQADPSPPILLQLEAESGWCHLQEERQEDAGGAGGEAWPLRALDAAWGEAPAVPGPALVCLLCHRQVTSHQRPLPWTAWKLSLF